jgi:hypothetical protein
MKGRSVEIQRVFEFLDHAAPTFSGAADAPL